MPKAFVIQMRNWRNNRTINKNLASRGSGNMINMLELKFINEFIVKEKKDRLIYEFSNPKKRENAIMRFSHKVENIVNDKFIQCRCNMGNLSNNLALSGDVYIVSLEKIYGETCPYKEALIHLNEQYMPVIIIGENTVIIKSENEDSKDNIFVLMKSTNN